MIALAVIFPAQPAGATSKVCAARPGSATAQAPSTPCLPATEGVLHASAMFLVTEADAAAIRTAFHEEGELAHWQHPCEKLR